MQGMKVAFFVLLSLLASGPALAQGWGKKHEGGGRQQQMRQEDRQRMREDMREVYRDRNADRNRAQQPQLPQRQMSQQDREKLRRDIQDANRDLRR
jgi:hypothetical protein